MSSDGPSSVKSFKSKRTPPRKGLRGVFYPEIKPKALGLFLFFQVGMLPGDPGGDSPDPREDPPEGPLEDPPELGGLRRFIAMILGLGAGDTKGLLRLVWRQRGGAVARQRGQLEIN